MDNRNLNLKFTSVQGAEKRILEIKKDTNYRLLAIEGLESSDFQLSLVSNSQYDGGIVDNKRISQRSITLTVEYIGKDMLKERQNIIEIFNPMNSGSLLVEYIHNENKILREIEYEIENFKIVQQNIYDTLSFTLSLICPDPFFKDKDESAKTLAVWEGGLTFPFSFPVNFGCKTIEAEERGIELNVLGHVDTPVEIEFKGPAKSPKITNETTGEYIKINQEIKEDEILYINTAYGNKKVRIVDEKGSRNAFNYIDLKSTFFSLKPGKNRINYSNDDDTLNQQSVTVRYKNRYLGI